MNLLLRLIVAGAVLLPVSEALAQASIEPGRIPQQFQPPAAPQSQVQLPETQIPEAVAPSEAAKVKVVLSEIRIDGATVYSESDLADLTKALVGHEISLAEVFSLANQITARYRQHDYILCRAVVPAQKLTNGVLHIRVVEGYVSVAEFKGPKNDLLQRYAAHLTAVRPLKGAILERYLLLMNAVPGMTVRAVLSPATGQTGGSLITLVTTEKNVDAYASIDNQGSRYMVPFESSLGVALNNIAGLGERTLLSYSFAYPQSELQYFNLHEEMPLGGDGLLLTVNAGTSMSKPGFTLRRLDARARGSNVGLQLSYPVIRSRAATWIISSKFDVINSRTIMNDDPLQTPSSNDQIRVLRFGTMFDFADTWGGHNLLSGEFSAGLRIFGASSNNRVNPSRPGGRSDFHKVTVDASRRQELGGVMENLDLLLAVSVQTSFGEKLLSTEQFGAGGAIFGRGYEPSEITGDDGIATKLELRYNLPSAMVDGGFQFFGFYDFAAVHNNAIMLGLPQSASLASTGAGVRFDVFDHVAGALEADKPLTKDIETEHLAGHFGKPWRAHFAVTVRY